MLSHTLRYFAYAASVPPTSANVSTTDNQARIRSPADRLCLPPRRPAARGRDPARRPASYSSCRLIDPRVSNFLPRRPDAPAKQIAPTVPAPRNHNPQSRPERAITSTPTGAHQPADPGPQRPRVLRTPALGPAGRLTTGFCAQAAEDAVDGNAGFLAGADRIGGLPDVHAGVAEKGGEQPGERFDGQRVDLVIVDGALQPGSQQPHPVLLNQLAPGAGAEHRGAVDEDDSLEVAARAGIKELLDALAQLAPRAACLAGLVREFLGDEPLRELGRDHGHHGAEQAGLVAEVVVERAAGDAGAGDDLFRPGVRVALLGEQPAGRLHQRGPGVLDVLGAPRCAPHATSMQRTSCMIEANWMSAPIVSDGTAGRPALEVIQLWLYRCGRTCGSART